MSITATVLDWDMNPVSDDFDVTQDGFRAVERFAVKAAAEGTKCCIRWTRDEDGQTAYWSPDGAFLKPHWYVRMGRPELAPEDRTRPRTIWMTDAEWAKVQNGPKGWVRGLVQKARFPA